MILALGCAGAPKQDPPPKSPPTAPVTAAPVAAKTEMPSYSVECKQNSAARTLKITAVQPKGCMLFYSNHLQGKEPLAQSTVGNTHCEQVRDRIRTKLETAGYKCSPDAKK